jgi:RHS repeat-associated protein
MYYIHTDHLGSYIALTNAKREVVQRNCFNPWGDFAFEVQEMVATPPNPKAGNGILNSLTFPVTRRGFTGHEHYPQFKIINMNGRLYDPVICRFFSPDNYIVENESTQDFNRYSYARNCPLMYTDPSGELLVIVGNQADISFRQLNSISNLALVRDVETGRITATAAPQNANDRRLLEIINNRNITVNLTATDGDIGNPDGGAFWGNRLLYNANGKVIGVSTDQRVNPLTNYLLDYAYGAKIGTTVLHEITESYLGGVLSKFFEKAAGKAIEGTTTHKYIYKPAHDNATPLPNFDEDKGAKFINLINAIEDIKNFNEIFKIW